MNDSYKNNKNTYKIVEEDEFDENEIRIQDLLALLIRRKKLVIFTSLFIFISSLLYTTYKRIYKPIYTGSFSVLISNPIDSAYTSKLPNSSIAEISSIASNAGQFSSDLPTLIAYLNSPVTLKDLANKLNKKPGSIAGMIKIDQKGRKINALRVKIRTADYKFGKKFIKELSSFYLSIANEQRQKSLGDGLDFLNKQEPELRKKTSDLQNKLSEFREKYAFLEPVNEIESLKIQEEKIQEKLLQLELNKKGLLSLRQDVINGKLSTRDYRERIGSTDPFGGTYLLTKDNDKSLLDQYFKAENELSIAKTKFTDKSKMVKLLKEKLEELKPKAIKKQIEVLDTAIELNRTRYKDQLNQKEELQETFRKKPNLVKEYNTLTESLLISKENLTALILARESFQLKMAQNTAPWRLLSEPSMRSKPIAPNIPVNIFYAFLISLSSGISIGFLRDRLDYVFRSPQDLEKEFKLPLLGSIPFVTAFKGIREKRSNVVNDLDNPLKEKLDPQDAKVFNSERFFYQESFRSLYTSLRFLGSDKTIKSFCFSSSLPSEGKSIISIVFAKTLSELGKKVLLVDADMRKPQVHMRLGMNNISGLSNIISSEDLSWRKHIQNVENHPNWKVISSGVKPPDPTRLISSKKMGDLVKDLEKSNEFDIVIYDTPPLLGLSDAIIISENTDGLALIVSLGKVNRDYPKEALRLIKKSDVNLLGLISNSVVKLSSDNYSNSAYKTYENYADDIDLVGQEIEKEIKQPTELNKFTKLIQYSQKVYGKIYEKAKLLMNWLDE